jgi:hypothetical protein
MLAEPVVWGTSTRLRDVLVDISGNEWAVSTPPTLQIDTMVGVAEGADAVGDVRALLGQARVFTTGCFERLCGVLQAHGRLWGAAWTARCGLVVRAVQRRLGVLELLPCCGDGLGGGPLCGGHRRADGLAAFMLPREHVR